MSLTNLDFLINQFPEEAASVRKLATYLESLNDSRERELTAQRISDLITPSSRRVLAKILICLVEGGVLEKFFRIESEAKGGIGDYHSMSEIPLSIFDFRLNRSIEVRLDQIRLMYRVIQHVES